MRKIIGTATIFLLAFGAWAAGAGAFGQETPKPAPIADRTWKVFGDAGASGTGADWTATARAPAGATGAAAAYADIDLRPYAGSRLLLSASVRTRGVTKPATPDLGVKFMLAFDSVHGQAWMNPNGLDGDFPWRDVKFLVAVPDDAGTGTLYLGLQGSSGEASFKDVRVTVAQPRIVRTTAAKKTAAIPSAQRFRGATFPSHVDERDFRDVRALGANLVRWQMWGEATDPYRADDPAQWDQWLDFHIAQAKSALDDAQKHGLKVVLDLHATPGGRTVDGDPKIFHDAKLNARFVAAWKKIAKAFSKHPALWAYGLVNEPLLRVPGPAGLDPWSTQVRAAKAIRAIDPKTTILVAADEMDSPNGFRFLKPVDVPGVAYEVHLYVPAGFTRQGVVDGIPPSSYPGDVGGRHYDKEALRQVLAPVLAFQRTTGARIFVGEFGAIRWADGADRYLADCISLFEEYGWDWSFFAFREWAGWDPEYADAPRDRNDNVRATSETGRMKVLKAGFAKNGR